MNLPLLGFPPETFARRREQALERLQGGALLLPSSPILHKSRDTEQRYRPDSELFYLTGSVEPGVVALLRDHGDGERFILFVPGRDPGAELWSGPRLGPGELGELLGADAAYPAEELTGRLPGLLKGASRIHFRLGVHPLLEAQVVEALKEARRKGPRKGEGARGVMDPGQVLDELRLRKDPEEVTRIRRATDLTVSAFREALGEVRPGMGEWELESALESGFRRRGARGPAFPTIVGSGANACVLHYNANHGVLSPHHLVLLDGGAEVDLYAGDVTRTFPAGGPFTGPGRDVYAVVLEAHQAALAAVQPGTRIEEVHGAAVAALTRGLVGLGVLAGDPEELAAGKGHETYFPHQTSHWLGLDVHDVGDYAVDGASRVLEPGMVLTVEPGLYFADAEPGAGPFAGIGIRVEDDVLVTSKGAEILTGDLPVTPGELEDLVGAIGAHGEIQ
jgi:Xaa-Pro aminopeptidase